MPNADLPIHDVTRSGGTLHVAVRAAIAAMAGLLAILVVVFHSGRRQYIEAADGRQFEVIRFAHQSSGQRHWVYFRYVTSCADQDSLQSEFEDLLPTLGRTLDSLHEQELQIQASRPIVRIDDIFALYHSYTAWLERDGQQWMQTSATSRKPLSVVKDVAPLNRWHADQLPAARTCECLGDTFGDTSIIDYPGPTREAQLVEWSTATDTWLSRT